jgi:hypothetical protein
LNLIATATPWVMGVVGLWLMKPRKGQTVKRKLTAMVDGKLREEEIYIRVHQSESPSDVVAKALSKLFGVSPSAVVDAINQAQSESK